MKLEFSLQNIEKYSNTKFHENPSSGSRVVPCGQTGGQTDMTQLIVAFSNFADAPKKKVDVSSNSTPTNYLCSMTQKLFYLFGGLDTSPCKYVSFF